MSDYDYELETNESSQINFDLKGLFFKIIGYWPLILISILIALGIAYYVNVRKQNVYRLESLISVENEQSPFFTTNTSISFNWGGVSGKVGKVVTEVNTRTHNELVVDSLQFYKQYLREGKYNLIDIYKKSPFEVIIDKTSPQMLGRLMEIKPIDDVSFELIVDFGELNSILRQNYSTREINRISISENLYSQKHDYGSIINQPFFKGTIKRNNEFNYVTESSHYFKFLNFDAIVNQYKNAVRATAKSRDASSILRMIMTGNNKARIVDYLNATVEILAKTELERKNLYATNTIKFIDSSLTEVDAVLKAGTNEMSDFRKRNKVFDVTDELAVASDNLKELDQSKELEKSKLQYLNSLENYLLTQKDYTKIVAPTSVGINEANIIASVQSITMLAIERQKLEYTTQPGNVLFDDLDRRINAEKNVLLETVTATKRTINLQLNAINNNIAKLESELRNLPEDQQEFLKIQRKLDVSIETYNVYQSKLSEAKIIKAANVSDITFIDKAKDIGGGKIGPNTSLNYIMASLLGFGLPILLVFVLYLLDNNIHNTGEVEKLSRIPILGLIGKFKHTNNLVVYEKPKSTVSESFRAIRSSLQFIYRQQQDSEEKGKTLMVTSSISGEGKTFCSINISTVYALSGKKTILLGLDLRKPKIFGDFNLDNDRGIVNYLIGEEPLENTIVSTHIENLDLISSGPTPPNPSELLMSKKLKDAIDKLRDSYDFIVLDTPPLGLVADALELSHYADATIYMIRFDYTKKGMLQLVNAKYKNGEVKNISFVLNFYKYKARYGYDYGYGYGYGSYGNVYYKNEKQSIWSKAKKLISGNKK